MERKGDHMKMEERQAWLEDTYRKLCVKLSAECDRIGSRIPMEPDDGVYRMDMSEGDNIFGWTNGFWPGILWQMYHAKGEEKYLAAARGVEEKLDRALHGFTRLDHDMGFIWMHSAVADYRLTGSEQSRTRGLMAANLEAGRYNPEGRFIRVWNKTRFAENSAGLIIVDCLMNLPLLYWASGETEDPRFAYIAKHHADTALRTILRADGSCNHIAMLDPGTGELLDTPGGQGYESGSSWSRGQAWAVYGMALSYRHTGNHEYLDAAKRAAHYFIANASLSGWVPLCDFRSPMELVYWDTSAGTIAACGLLELAEHVPSYEKKLYEEGAWNLLTHIESAWSNWDPETDAVVYGGKRSYHDNLGQRALIYADYFFLEGVLRLLGREFMIW